ncbi:hypothetical protein FQN54_003818 [Arachnomyces sp. PD_36]|nr:hypothetical protein FQN54_003818 [Arachnomyces sp. PD_36]
MGWFWSDSNKNDPTKKLDPGLREYLQKETPEKYTPVAPPPPAPESPPPPPTSQPTSESTNPEDSKPTVPAASLFPDGRYAHLWKDYQTPVEAELSTKPPAERVVEQFNKRKDFLNRAAVENCAEEQEALTLCFKRGDFQERMWARMTLCSAENTQFGRCYEMQSKFLQALGYASNFDWDSEKEERIQMHADKLYHQMLDYETRVEEAKAAGLEPPPMTSLFNPQAKPTPHPSSPSDSTMVPGSSAEDLAQIKDPKLKAAWKDLSPHEREVEVQAIKAKFQNQHMYEKEVSGLMNKEDAAREKRRRKMVGWFGETLGSWLT